VWNGTSFESYSSGSVGNYDTAFTDEGGGFYTADFDADIPAGIYILVTYFQSGGSPADTDNVIGSATMRWDGDFELRCITQDELDELEDDLSNSFRAVKNYYDERTTGEGVYPIVEDSSGGVYPNV